MPVLAQLNDNVVVHRFPLDEKRVRIGRNVTNEVCIDSPEVSGEHALIERDDKGAFTIVDLDSTNHTFVNEKPVQQRVLAHNDVIRIGWVVFKYLDEAHPDHTKTDKIHKSWIPGVYYTR